MNYHSISVYQDRYATSILDKYLYTVTFKKSKKFYKTNFPSDIIFAKNYLSISDEKVVNFFRKYNIQYRSCIGLFIYLLSTRLYFSFSVHKL